MAACLVLKRKRKQRAALRICSASCCVASQKTSGLNNSAGKSQVSGASPPIELLIQIDVPPARLRGGSRSCSCDSHLTHSAVYFCASQLVTIAVESAGLDVGDEVYELFVDWDRRAGQWPAGPDDNTIFGAVMSREQSTVARR